jgi:DNA-binding NarL/FixJ family response regulator
LDHGDSV